MGGEGVRFLGVEGNGYAVAIGPRKTSLQREESDLAAPFFRFTSRPDDEQILNGETNIEILRDDDQPWTLAAIEESRKVCRHCLAVMRNQNPPQIGCFRSDEGR